MRTFIRKSGDNSEEVTPVPISNTVVKLLSADDTWREAAWESRTLPVLLKKRVHFDELVFFSAAYKTGQRSEYRRYERRNEGEARVLPVFSFFDS